MRPCSSIRRPTVGPRWETGSARIARRAERELLVGEVVEGELRRHFGQLHREERRRQVARDPLLEAFPPARAAPRRGSRAPGSQRGTKKPRPSRWSRCRCVRMTWIGRRGSRASSRPSSRMPGARVEHDRACRRASSSWTQDVFPPKATVSGPGAASDPRQPHTVAFIASRRSQKTATTPSSSSRSPSSGNAVTSISCRMPSAS